MIKNQTQIVIFLLFYCLSSLVSANSCHIINTRVTNNQGVSDFAGYRYKLDIIYDTKPVVNTSAIVAQESYKVIFDGNGYTVGTLPDSFTFVGGDIREGVSSPPIIGKKNHLFVQWKVSYQDNGQTKVLDPDSIFSNSLIVYPSFDINISAEWSALPTFNLFFKDELNGDSTWTEAASNLLLLPIPSKIGYDFIGWECKYGILDSTEIFRMPNEDFELKAKWLSVTSPSMHRVFYSSWDDSNIQDDVNWYVKGDVLTLPSSIPERKGYFFEGWKVNGYNTLLTFNDSIVMPDNNLVICESWIKYSHVIYRAGQFGAMGNVTANELEPEDQRLGDSVEFNILPGSPLPMPLIIDTLNSYQFCRWLRIKGQEGGSNTVGCDSLEYIAQYIFRDPNSSYLASLSMNSRDTLYSGESFNFTVTTDISSPKGDSRLRLVFPEAYFYEPLSNIADTINIGDLAQGYRTYKSKNDTMYVEYDLEEIAGKTTFTSFLRFKQFKKYFYEGKWVCEEGTPEGYTANVRLELLNFNGQIVASSTVNLTNLNKRLILTKYYLNNNSKWIDEDNTVLELGSGDTDHFGFLSPTNNNVVVFSYNVFYDTTQVDGTIVSNYGEVGLKDVTISEVLPEEAVFDPELNPAWNHLYGGVINDDMTWNGGVVVAKVLDYYVFSNQHGDYAYSEFLRDYDLNLIFPNAKMHNDSLDDGIYINDIDSSDLSTFPYLNTTYLSGSEFNVSESSLLGVDSIKYFIAEDKGDTAIFKIYGTRHSFLDDKPVYIKDNFDGKIDDNIGYALGVLLSGKESLENIYIEDFGLDLTHFEYNSLGLFYDGEGAYKNDATIQYMDKDSVWNILASDVIPTRLPTANERDATTVKTNYILPSGVLGVRLKSNDNSYLEAGTNLYLVIDIDVIDSYILNPILSDSTLNIIDSNNKYIQSWYSKKASRIMYFFNYVGFHGEWKGLTGSERNANIHISDGNLLVHHTIHDGSKNISTTVVERQGTVSRDYFTPKFISSLDNESYDEEDIIYSRIELGSKGDLLLAQNVRVFVQLPLGAKFINDSIAVKLADSSHTSIRYNDSWYNIVDDWRGESRETLIINLKDWTLDSIQYDRSSLLIDYKVKLSPFISQTYDGKTYTDYYCTMDDNDTLKWDVTVVEDSFFLSGGFGDNKSESNYMHAQASNFVSISEQITGVIFAKCQENSSYTRSPDSVLLHVGDTVDYMMRVSNSFSSKVYKNLEIVNVLPYDGDYVTLDNFGNYDLRGSNRDMYITGPIDSVEGYSSFYTMVQGKKDWSILSVDNTTRWYTKNEVLNDPSIEWSDMRAIKVKANPGVTLDSLSMIDFVYHVVIGDSVDVINEDKINNSFVFRSDTDDWTETVKVRCSFSVYNLSGYVFLDKNNNGERDDDNEVFENEDTIRIEQCNLNGSWNTAIDDFGNPYLVTCNSTGYYTINIHQPGVYRVLFPSKNEYEITNYFEIDSNSIKSNVRDHVGQLYVSDSILLGDLNINTTVNAGFKVPNLPPALISHYDSIFEYDASISRSDSLLSGALDPDMDILSVISILYANDTVSVNDTLNMLYGELSVTDGGDYSYAIDTTDVRISRLNTGDLLYDTALYYVSDMHDHIVSDSIFIAILGDNDPPVANPDRDTTYRNKSITFDITSNDIDVDGVIDVSSVDLDVVLPGHQDTLVTSQGVFSIVSDQLTFTPNHDVIDSVTFEYNVCDNDKCLSNNARVTVIILDIQHQVIYDLDSGYFLSGFDTILYHDTALHYFNDIVDITSEIPFKRNNKFIGWLYSNIIYNDGQSLVMPDEDITLIAQWEGVRLFIPEIFTPNDDGVHDRFKLVWEGEYHDQISVKIFNRWGDLVFRDDDYQDDWDGRCNTGITDGGVLPDGTYFYVIEMPTWTKIVQGSVYIAK